MTDGGNGHGGGGQLGQLSKWIDDELTKDPQSAFSQPILDTCWDIYCIDPAEWELLDPVLRKHKIFDQIFAHIKERQGVEPDPPPAPTDDHNPNNRRRRAFVDDGSAGKIPHEEQMDFWISKITKIQTRPPIYIVEIDGSSELRLSYQQLRSLQLFEDSFGEELDRIPAMPSKPWMWKEVVNYHLRHDLVKREQPHESSEFGMLVSELRELLDRLPVGDTIEDLNHNRILHYKDDEFMAKPGALCRLLKERTGLHVKPENLGEMMGEHLDAVFKPGMRVDGRQVRVWVFRRESEEPSAEPSNVLPLHDA